MLQLIHELADHLFERLLLFVIAEAVHILLLMVMLLRVTHLQEKLEEFYVFQNGTLTHVILDVFDEFERVSVRVENSNGYEVFVKKYSILLLHKLRVVLVLILEPVHVAEVGHRLHEKSLGF